MVSAMKPVIAAPMKLDRIERIVPLSEARLG
jgi:hypothetical protein